MHIIDISACYGQMRDVVRTLALLFPAAIVSGRGREKVQNFVQLRELFYAGSHGMDIVGPQVRGSPPHRSALDNHVQVLLAAKASSAKIGRQVVLQGSPSTAGCWSCWLAQHCGCWQRAAA